MTQAAINQAALGHSKVIVKPVRSVRNRKDTIDIHVCPIFFQDENGKAFPIVIETNIFNANCIYQKRENERSLPIEKGACPPLEELLANISQQVWPQLLESLRKCPEKVPKFAKKLLQPSASFTNCFQPFFNKETHWFKLSPQCKIFNATTKQEMTELPSKGLYKAMLRLSSIYLGQHGSQQEQCCSITSFIDQVAVQLMDNKVEAPQTLVLNLDEFTPKPPTPKLPTTKDVEPPAKPPTVKNVGPPAKKRSKPSLRRTKAKNVYLNQTDDDVLDAIFGKD